MGGTYTGCARCPGAVLEAFTSQRLHHRAQVQRVTAGDIWVGEEGGQGWRTKLGAVMTWQDTGIGNVTWLDSGCCALETIPAIRLLAAAG